MMMNNEPTLSMDMAPIPTNMLPMSMSASDLNPDPFSMMMGLDVGPPAPGVRPAAAPASPAAPAAAPPAPIAPNSSEAQPLMPMPVPSMTMTIQSEPGGGSAIELSTSIMSSPPANASAPLIQRPHQRPSNKWLAQQHNQQSQLSQFNDNFDEPVDQSGGGEQYYSSPWPAKWPLASPAKVLRNERPKADQQVLRPTGGSAQQRQPSPSPLAQAHHQQPIVIMKGNDWRQPAPPTKGPSPGQARFSEPNLRGQQQQQQQQLIDQALEFEELIPLGPPRMMPVYQTANGQLHLSPPPPDLPRTSPRPSWQPRRPEPSAASSIEREGHPNRDGSGGTASGANNANDQNSEVQTIGNGPAPVGRDRVEPETPVGRGAQVNVEADRGSGGQVSSSSSNSPQSSNIKRLASTKTSSRLTSPAVKGKQQQQKSSTPSPPKTKPPTTSSSY